MTVFINWYENATSTKLTSRSAFRQVAQWIIDRNILIGNMLATNADDTPSGRDNLQIVDYDWKPATRTVAITATTLGAVLSAGAAEATGVMSLFDTVAPAITWEGAALDLRKAPITEPAQSDIEARNGTTRRTA